MKLQALFEQISVAYTPNHAPMLDLECGGLSTHSQQCQPGDLFIGMAGTRVDGGQFWPQALESGAIAAVISENAAAQEPPKSGDPVVVVADLNLACAQLAAAFGDHPAKKMQLVGVTGTNGKTTITHLVEFFLQRSHQATALFGTLYHRWRGYEKTASFTTPFPVELQQQFAKAVAAGSDYGVMEVSSHALAQGRVKTCEFAVAVFTNLTQDHLDYHRDFESYFQAKALLFSPEYLSAQGRAVINLDDPYGRKLLTMVPRSQTWSYSIDNPEADFYTADLHYDSQQVRGTLHSPQGEFAFCSPLVGQFNLSNVLAALGVIASLGLDLGAVIPQLPEFSGVPGRMERVTVTADQDLSVIVDYAHTPDSLKNMLVAARPFIPGKMICVFGCGGDRDRTKRPMMGRIAAELADWAVVTSDNPRTEDPDRILADVQEGIPANAHYDVIGDRRLAIHTAIAQAQPGDGVLIAGKGHEDYQILGTEKVHFDDREEARQALENRLGS